MLIESGKRPDERNVISARRVDLHDVSRLRSLYDRVFEKEQGGRNAKASDRRRGVSVDWKEVVTGY
jgi:hypothetical protein